MIVYKSKEVFVPLPYLFIILVINQCYTIRSLYNYFIVLLVLMYIMLWVLGPITLLVQHTYTCTTLYLYRTLMPPILDTDVYFLIKKYNTNLPVFLTWYQSHYSNIFLAILSLLA